MAATPVVRPPPRSDRWPISVDYQLMARKRGSDECVASTVRKWSRLRMARHRELMVAVVMWIGCVPHRLWSRARVGIIAILHTRPIGTGTPFVVDDDVDESLPDAGGCLFANRRSHHVWLSRLSREEPSMGSQQSFRHGCGDYRTHALTKKWSA